MIIGAIKNKIGEIKLKSVKSQKIIGEITKQ